jgi:hypothetical protein
MGGAYGTYGGDEKCIQGFLVRKPEGKRPDKSCRRDERMILKFILNKQDLRAWNELIWLGIWTRGELL